MTKKIFRSKKDRVIFGVCGGLGEYFEVDPVLFRLAFVIVTLIGGSGILIYLIMALVIPSTPDKKIREEVRDNINEVVNKIRPEDRKKKREVLGWTLLIVGILFLLKALFPFCCFGFAFSYFLWPVLIIILAFYILLK